MRKKQKHHLRVVHWIYRYKIVTIITMEDSKMSISGIGATGYPAAGYEIRRTARNIAGRIFRGRWAM